MAKRTAPILIFGGTLIVMAFAPPAFGHGTPIHVEAAGGQLIVSQGLPDSNGFAPMIFVEDDDDGDPFGNLNVPPFGPVIVWQVPGFDIVNLNNESSLSIEVLLRPVADSTPPEMRTLWYWNDDTQEVEPAPATSALHLLALGNRTRTLLPTDTAAPSPLLLADSLTGQQGFHNHGLLGYALDNDPPPPSGAYGFFAQLASDTYAPSDPFLVVLNRSVANEQMTTAALAINAAALGAAPIVGDYDNDGNVDADDYNFWRARFGSTVTPLASPDGNGNGNVDAADYVIWRHALQAPGAAAVHAAMIPEPSTTVLLWLALALVGRRR